MKSMSIKCSGSNVRQVSPAVAEWRVLATLWQAWQLQLIGLTILDSMLRRGLALVRRTPRLDNHRSSTVLPFAFYFVWLVASLLLFLELVYIQCLACLISFCPFGLNSDDVQHKHLRTRKSRNHRQIKGKPVLLAGLLPSPR